MLSETPTLALWQRLWWSMVGATSVLVVTASNPFPSLSRYHVTLLGWFFNPLYSGWIWALLLLEALCFGSGILLLVHPHWRALPGRQRLNAAWAFFGLAWIGVVAWLFHFPIETPPVLLWVAMSALLVLVSLYWFGRYRIDAQEARFP